MAEGVNIMSKYLNYFRNKYYLPLRFGTAFTEILTKNHLGPRNSNAFLSLICCFLVISTTDLQLPWEMINALLVILNVRKEHNASCWKKRKKTLWNKICNS